MTSNYRRGADFERKVRDYFIDSWNAALVVRSAGSKTVVDLVAFFNDGRSPCLVQVKRTGRMTQAAKAQFKVLARSIGALPVVASGEKIGRREEVVLEWL